MDGLRQEQEEHRARQRVNILAGIFLICLMGLALWTVKIFTDQEKLQRCLDSRRTNCFDAQLPERDGVRVPSR